MKAIKIFTIMMFLSLTGCSWRSASDQSYRWVRPLPAERAPNQERYLLVCVNARHLNYHSETTFFSSLQKHPSDASKNGDVGHAWIALVGDDVIEVGHSGELGVEVPKYFDGVMDLADSGEPNPIQYLWQTLPDGFRQGGAGGHYPTLVVRFPLSKEQYNQVERFIEAYDYASYSIREHQCASFVAEAALIAGIDLAHQIEIPIAPYLEYPSGRLQLWEDQGYSSITVSTPDALEKSLREAVLRGEGEVAMGWYRRHLQKDKVSSSLKSVRQIPKRMWRWVTAEGRG